MISNLTDGIVRILRTDNRTAGTGFVIREDGWIATCAHVVIDAKAGPGGTVSLVFLASKAKEIRTAVVEAEYWRDPDKGEDIAILRLQGSLPKEVVPLPLGSSMYSGDHNFSTFGFPPLNSLEGMRGSGKVLGIKLQEGFSVLQLWSEEVTQGFSGAPVWDNTSQVVIGMITSSMENKEAKIESRTLTIPSDPNWRFLYTAFATPTETLREVYPELQVPPECPYRQFVAFTEADAHFFYGRDGLVEDLLSHLHDSPRFLAVFGPSGSGKSSVVQAGLIPKLREGRLLDSNHWEICITRPADDPFQLRPETSPMNSVNLTQRVNTWLERHPEQTSRFVLIVDQFEESLASEDLEPNTFIAQLADLYERSPRVTLIIIMRNDFYSQYMEHDALRKWLKESKRAVDIPQTLTSSELEAIIREPGRRGNVYIQDGLIDLLVKDAIEKGEQEARSTILPLLEFTLTRLWEKRQNETLTLDAYNNMHGIKDEFTLWANITCDNLKGELPSEYRHLVQRIFIDLVHIGVGDKNLPLPNSRQRKSLISLCRDKSELKAIQEIVNKLVDARLLVKMSVENEEMVEIIHDVLLNEWRYLNDWIVYDRKFLTWHQKFEKRFKEWEQPTADHSQKREKHKLLAGSDLVEAEDWLKKREVDLHPYEEDFIKISRKRQRWEQNRVVAALLIFLAIVSVLASAAGLSYFRAEKELQIARSQGLAAQAQNYMLKNQFDLALLLSVKAYQTDNNYETRDTLLTTLENSSHINKILYNYTDFVFSSDSRTLLSSRSYGTITLWDLPTGKSRSLLIPIPKNCNNMQLDPDGNKVAAVCPYGVGIWNIMTGRQLLRLSLKIVAHQNSEFVKVLTFSPDGHLLAIDDSSGNIVVWNLDSGKPSGPPLHALDLTEIFFDEINAMPIAFSPDGKLLASSLCSSPPAFVPCGGIRDQQIFIWDIASGKRISTITSHQFGVMSLAFSPNGQLLAAGGANDIIALWNMQTQQPLGSLLIGHTDSVVSLAFSPDGKKLVSGSADKTVRLWDVATQRNSGDPFLGHQVSVSAVSFSPDGQQLVSGSSDNTLIIWNLTSDSSPIRKQVCDNIRGGFPYAFDPSGHLLAMSSYDVNGINLCDVTTGTSVGLLLYNNRTERTGSENLKSLAFSPDSRLLASYDDKATITLWNVATKKPVKNFKSPPFSSGDSLMFSPDGRLLALYGGSIPTLWDITTGQARPLRNHGTVEAIAFSSDGEVLALGGSDKTIMLVDVATGKPIGQPLSDSGGVYPVAFSPDGRILVTGSSSGTIALWDTTDQKLISHLPIKSSGGEELSPDGKILSVVSGAHADALTLWDMTSQEIIAHPLLGPFKPPDPFAPYNLGAFIPYTIGEIMSGPNGQLLTANFDARGGEAVILWNTSITSWIAHACSIANRNLTLAEWKQFVGNEPFSNVCPDHPL